MWKSSSGRRGALVFVLLSALLVMSVVVSVMTGSVSIPLIDAVKALIGQGDGGTYDNIILQIRLPRVLLSAVLGGALALSGFLLQTFFGNPIAGPFVLGISSGAKLTVALTMVFLLGRAGVMTSFALVGAAFVGSLACVGFILLLSRRLKHMATLLVAGIMIGYICSAATDFIVTFADESDIINLRGWSLGSFSGASWQAVSASAAITALCFVSAFLLSKPISAYQMGEVYARSVGVRIGAFRVVLILVSSLLSACVTAFAGPISFVGIAVPYLMRRALNTSRPIAVIPACVLGGAVFCVLSDLLARWAFAPTELNISTVTSIFGAPVVIVMMLRRHREV